MQLPTTMYQYSNIQPPTMSPNNIPSSGMFSHNNSVEADPENNPYFSPAEDDLLVYLNTKYGGKWTKIASKLNHKTARQCRERWKTHFSHRVTTQWTEEETKQLMEYHKVFGVSYDIIGKLLNRSQTQVKNRINAVKKKGFHNLFSHSSSVEEEYTSQKPVNADVVTSERKFSEPVIQINMSQPVTTVGCSVILPSVDWSGPMDLNEFIAKFQ